MYNINFDSLKDAQDTLTAMQTLLSVAGEVILADFHELYDTSSTYEDYGRGWSNLDNAQIKEATGYSGHTYYILSLPDVIDLDCDGTETEVSNVERHADICSELNALYERKNHDYGDAFHQTWLEEGFAMARIRLTDKLNRFKTLSRLSGQEGMVADESLRDTLIDLANYAIMTIMEMDRDKEEDQ